MSISVIVPNYNHGKYLPDCLHAIYKQKKQPDEVIVVDDLSTDNSLEILDDFQSRYPNLKIVKNQSRKGPFDSINQEISKTKGDFLAFCAADDLVLPDFFADATTFFSKYPNAGLCTGDPCFFENNNIHVQKRQHLLATPTPCFFSPEEVISLFRKTPFFIFSHVSLFRKKAFSEIGGFPSIYHMSDWYLNCKIALHYGIGYVPKPFGAFRLLQNSFGHSYLKSKEKRKKALLTLLATIDQEDTSLRKKIDKSLFLSQLNLIHFVDMMSILGWNKPSTLLVCKKIRNIFQKGWTKSLGHFASSTFKILRSK